MNITLTVVVSAIVILITALVVITIFGGSMGNIATTTQGKSVCEASCTSSCRSLGVPPITWNAETVRDANGNPTTCQALAGTCTCTGSNAPAETPSSSGGQNFIA